MTTVLFHSIRHTQYLETTDASCKTYSDFDVFKYNYFVWCITFFFIGCQWTHINELAPGFTLTPASIKTWKKGSWAIFLALIIAIVVIIHAVWKVYKVSGVLNLYVTYIFAVVGYMVYKTCKSHSQDRTVHIHHYCIGFFMMSLICCQSILLTAIHGFFNGMFIEGGATWGFDAIWPTKDDEGDEEICFEW